MRESCCGGLIFANFNEGIKFTSDYLISEEKLRQIMEKYILGEINYDFTFPGEQTVFVYGHSAPQIKLLNLERNQNIMINKIENENMILTFFASFCGICKTGKRIQMLSELKSDLMENESNPKIIVIFQKPFDRQDVEEITEKISIPFELYLSDNILPAEQEYITDDRYKNNPLTVVIKKGEVIFVEKMEMTENDILNHIRSLYN